LAINSTLVNKKLQTVYDALQQQREAVLAQVKLADKSIFTHSPAPGKWSLSQILTHLMTAEKLSVGYMKKKVQAADHLKNAGLAEAFRLWTLTIAQRVPLKYKAPRVVTDNTPNDLPLDELIRQWDQVRDDLATLLANLDEKNLNKVIYRHPIAGRLSAHQAVVTLIEHFAHHKPQIERLLKKSI
jgi:hypothetical protein